MKTHPFLSEHLVRGTDALPHLDSSIKHWLTGHEEIEDELGIVTPQEDVPNQQDAEDEEEDELVYHFR